MMNSAITISLVEEARSGPFVFHDGLADGCRRAAAAGFDAVELFVPSADPAGLAELPPLLDQHQLSLAAIGTGAGWVKHQLSLTDADADVRQKARDFVRSIIDLAAGFDAPAIIGSMQGRHANGVTRDQALGLLREALGELGEYAAGQGQVLLYEPLNRYETNLANTLEAASALIDPLKNPSVKLLADLFHMNIEERDIADALRVTGDRVGHVHFVDSNRHAAGYGHIDHAAVVTALTDIGYDGYLCAEALPLPDADAAAATTIATIKNLVAQEDA